MSEDILERAKKALIDDDMTYEDYDECISLLIAEVERLRSELAVKNGRNELLEYHLTKEPTDLNNCYAANRWLLEQIDAYKARIKELEAVLADMSRRAERLLVTVTEDEAYRNRLEAAFLEVETERKFYATVNGMSSDCDWKAYPEKPSNGIHKEWFRQQAREALERIRNGE